MAKNLRTNALEGGLTVDPTAGAGVPAAIGAFYSRRGTTQWWLKTGAAATAWTLVVAGAPVGTILVWGNDSVAAPADTRFLDPGRKGTASTTDISRFALTRAGTLRNFFVRHNTPAGDGDTITYTVMVNGAATAITVTQASNVTAQVSDLVNTVAVVQGDFISIRAVKNADITNGAINVQATLELV